MRGSRRVVRPVSEGEAPQPKRARPVKKQASVAALNVKAASAKKTSKTDQPSEPNFAEPSQTQQAPSALAYATSVTEHIGAISASSQKLLSAAMNNLTKTTAPPPYDPRDIAHAFRDFGLAWFKAPMHLMTSQAHWPREYWKVWRNAWDRMSDPETLPLISPAKTDRRFRSDAWNSAFPFDLIKQTYLLMGQQI